MEFIVISLLLILGIVVVYSIYTIISIFFDGSSSKKYSPELDQALKYINKGLKNKTIKKVYPNTLEDTISGTRYQIYIYSEIYKFRKQNLAWIKVEDCKPKIYTLYKLKKLLKSIGTD